MSKKWLIRFDADGLVGMGHLTRCLALAQEGMRRGLDVLLIGKKISPVMAALLSEQDVAFESIPDTLSWADEADYLVDQWGETAEGIVFDIATAYAFDDISGVNAYVDRCGQSFTTVLLDGMAGNALADKVSATIDVVIVPYFGADTLTSIVEQHGQYLLGEKYYLFSSCYVEGVVDRKVQNKAQHVLVTMGGADSCDATMVALDALEQIESVLSVRVVVGPAFNDALKQQIGDASKASKHVVDIVDAPSSLIEHMYWCDLAMTSAGLTKYELAVTGTPTLQVAFNDDHDEVNRYFTEHGSAICLGVLDRVTIDDFAKKVYALLGDVEQRKKMSQIGQRLLDTQGAQRLWQTIEG